MVDGKPVIRKEWFFGKWHVIKYNSHYESSRMYGCALGTNSRFGHAHLDFYAGKNVYVFRSRDV
jgi:hypothetical protein